MRFLDILSILLIVAMAGVLFVSALGMASALPPQDFAQYWAAAHLASQNPYSLQLTTDFERSFGYSTTGAPMVLRSPPWAIVLLLPLGLLSYQTGFAVWFVFSIAVVAGCARAAWNLSNSSPSLAPAFLSLLFAPTICLLMLGQLTVLVLLGITLFLTMAERRRDWLAGASLLLVLLKPHVVFLFLIAVSLWAVQFKRWTIVLSSLVALITASIVAVAFDPRIFAHYVEFAGQFVRETPAYPNIGGILYVASERHYLAFLPQAIGIVWLIFYWRRHRADWDWKAEGLMVLLVSVTCSYYSFAYDEILLLPALIAAFANGNRTRFLIGFLATNVGYAFYLSKAASHFGFSYMFLWWTASAWLITYLFSYRSRPVLRTSPI